jgi:hypothetical protein
MTSYSSYAVLRFTNDLAGVWVVSLPLFFRRDLSLNSMLLLQLHCHIAYVPQCYLIRGFILTRFVIRFRSWHLAEARLRRPFSSIAYSLTLIFYLTKGFLGVIVTRPNDIAALDFPESVTDLCAARPVTESLYTTEAGRKRRNFDRLEKSDKGREVTNNIAQGAKHRRNRWHV